MFFERHDFTNQDLPIYFSHQVWHSGEPNFQLHWHETPEFILITSGRVEIRISDKTEVYSAGELAVINPQSAHSFRALDGECSYYCLIPDNSLLATGGISPAALSLANRICDEAIIFIYGKIVEEIENKQPHYEICVRALIQMMTALLLRGYTVDQRRAGRFDDNAMCIAKDAIQYIEDHYTEQIDGIEIAAALGISRSYLCHVIRKVTHQTVTDNLLYVRCRKAKELLWAGYPIQEVVDRTGFNSVSYFYRTYKKMMGVPPSADRKMKIVQERRSRS